MHSEDAGRQKGRVGSNRKGEGWGLGATGALNAEETGRQRWGAGVMQRVVAQFPWITQIFTGCKTVHKRSGSLGTARAQTAAPKWAVDGWRQAAICTALRHLLPVAGSRRRLHRGSQAPDGQ